MISYQNSGNHNSPTADLVAISEYIQELEKKLGELLAARRNVWDILFETFELSKPINFLSQRDYALYLASLRPTERNMDIATAQKGYDNLLYHGRPVAVNYDERGPLDDD